MSGVKEDRGGAVGGGEQLASPELSITVSNTDDGRGPTPASGPARDLNLAGATMTADPVSPKVPGLGSPASLPLLEVPLDNYEMLGEQGRGGIGVVRRARDRRLDREVAIKELQRDSHQARLRFEREMRITAKLQHPGVVPVHEAGRWPDGAPFYAMKLVEGRSLKEIIAEKRTLDERLALLPHVLAVAEAIAFAHSQGILHRDLKPSNVIVGAYGETVVIDWGLAKDLSSPEGAAPVSVGPYRTAPDGELTAAGQILGTPAYMAPEQARGEEVDARADVYAIGGILYHVLAGQPPYRASNSAHILEALSAGPPVPLQQQVPGMPGDLVAIVEKAMHRQPDGRYSAVGFMVEDLRRFLTGQLVSAYAYTPSALLTRWVRNHRLPVLAGVIALVAITVTIMASFSRVLSARERAEEAQRAAETERAVARGERNNVILTHARESLATDPTASVAWLKQLPHEPSLMQDITDIAADAASRGVASHVLEFDSGITQLQLSDSQELLVVGTADGHYRFLDLRSMSIVGKTTAHNSGAIAVDGDGAVVALALENGDIKIWRRSQRESSIAGHSHLVLAAALAGDGRQLFTGGEDGQVRFADVESGTSNLLYKQSARVRVLALSRDERMLASASGDGELMTYDLRSRSSRKLTTAARAVPIADLQFLADGRIVTADMEGFVSIWDTAGRPGARTRVHDGPIDHIRLSQDSGALVTVGADQSLRRLDLASLSVEIIGTHPKPITNTTLSEGPDGPVLVSSSSDGTVRVWDLLERTSRPLVGHKSLVSAVAVAKARSGEAHAITASLDGQLRLWPLGARVSRSLYRHAGGVLAIKASPDGHHFATCGRDARVILADAGGGHVSLLGHRTLVYGLWFSSGGERLASVSWDREVRIWDVSSHAQLATAAMPGPPNSLTFGESPYVYIAVGNNINEWNYVTGELRSVAEVSKSIDYLEMSVDRTRLLAILEDEELLAIRLADSSTSSIGHDVVSIHAGQYAVFHGGAPDAHRLIVRDLVTEAAHGPWPLSFDPTTVIFNRDTGVFFAFDGEGHGSSFALDSGLVRSMRGSSIPAVGMTILSRTSVLRLLEDGAIELWDFSTPRRLPLREHESAGRGLARIASTGALVLATIDGRIWMADRPRLDAAWHRLTAPALNELTDWTIDVNAR